MSDEKDAIRPDRFTWNGEDMTDVEFEDDPDENWPVDLPDTSFDHSQIPKPDDEVPVMDLTRYHYKELIRLALNKRAGWVPLGPLSAARRGRKLLTYHRANELADLEKAGLVSIVPGKNDTGTIRLTEAGRAAILAMPDDLHVELYPLPVDIAAAKAKLRDSQATK